MSSGRFQIPDQPVSPGICRICGVQFGVRPLLDTSLDADFCNRPHSDIEDFAYSQELMGAVYFCSECVGAMADMFGWISPKRAQELKDEYAAIQRENEELLNQNLGMESIINGYQKLGISSDGPATSVRSVIGNAEIDSVSDSGNGVREEGQPSGTGDSDSNVESPTGDNIPEDETGREGQGSSEINEPVNVEEHDGLPRDSGSGPTVNLERESESALGF